MLDTPLHVAQLKERLMCETSCLVKSRLEDPDPVKYGPDPQPWLKRRCHASFFVFTFPVGTVWYRTYG